MYNGRVGRSPDIILDYKHIYGYIVYGWRRDKEYLYIGQARQIGRLSTAHHIIGKREPVLATDQFDFWLCESHTAALDLEWELIRECKPKYNRETLRLLERVIEKYKSDEEKLIEEAEKKYGYKLRSIK